MAPSSYSASDLLLSLLTTLLLLHLPTALCHELSQEGLGLLALKRAIVADPFQILSDWDVSHPTPCNWTGIRCDPLTKSVISIHLAGNNLNGVLVAELSRLKKLHRLYLHYNNFHGSIPSELTKCTRLRTLSLHHNNFAGSIPSQIINFRFLRIMYLHNNNLSGPILPVLGGLRSLRNMDLSYNSLGGGIPSEIGNLSSLVYLNFSYNYLEGSIPTNGVFKKFGFYSFVGNLRLCGNHGSVDCSVSASELNSSVSKMTDPKRPTSKEGNFLLQSNTVAIIVIVAGVFVFFKAICCTTLILRWSIITGTKETDLANGGKLVMFNGGLSISSPKNLMKQICKLEPKDAIGEGGYGIVYKLEVEPSVVLAIKKLKQCAESSRDFEAEVETLGAVKHRNLVKLLGYCSSPTVKLLLYEYLPNGNLEQLLHSRDGSDQKPLAWFIRHKIALGVARGLAYLHHDCNPRIIHRDISSSNVLLDAEYEAYIADFGLARILSMYDTHVTATVAGKFGYMAPEYAQAGKTSEKVDVYSFGVILLELLSDKRPADANNGEYASLVAWAWRLQEAGKEADMVGTYLRHTAPEGDVRATLCLALSCVSRQPERRPTMKQALKCLEMEDLHSDSATLLSIDDGDGSSAWTGSG